MTEERAPDQPLRISYLDDQAKVPVPHQHQFGYISGGKRVIRYCEECNRSWMVGELRDLVSSRTMPCWIEVVEEEQARDKLDELNQPLPPRR